MARSGVRDRGVAQLDQALFELVAGRDPDPIAPEDAERFRTLVLRNGLSGLAGRSIERGRLEVPGRLAERMLGDWEMARRRCALLDLELSRIAGAMGRVRSGGHLSPPLVLKGPSVASRYADPPVRPYLDVDLLVPAGELSAWGTFLGELGYRGPGPWKERDWGRFAHHVQYRRRIEGGELLCEVHTRVSMQRHARRVDYGLLRRNAEPSPLEGTLRCALPAQLLVLALHFAHHALADRKLIWLRDFIELGEAGAVEKARALAASLDLTWAVERALKTTEQIVGDHRWNARSVPVPAGFGLARVQEMERAGDLYYFALMRELGLRGSLRFLSSRFDLRRFLRPEGGVDMDELRSWMKRRGRGIRAVLGGRRSRRDRP